MLENVASAEAADDIPIVFTLSEPSGLFVSSLVRLYVVSEAIVTANTAKDGPYGDPTSIPVISTEAEQPKPVRAESRGEIPSPVNIPKGCSFNTRCPLTTDACFEVDPTMVPLSESHVVRGHLFEDAKQPV